MPLNAYSAPLLVFAFLLFAFHLPLPLSLLSCTIAIETTLNLCRQKIFFFQNVYYMLASCS